MSETTASFEIQLTPVEGLLAGTGRFDFTKTWTGGLDGVGTGVMMSAGDPNEGTAGYVALETFEGSLDGRHGTLAFQQMGAMAGGEQALSYVISPGSGTGELVGISGTVELTVDGTGAHHVRLTYDG